MFSFKFKVLIKVDIIDRQQVFSKINLRSGYNQIKIRSEDVPKMDFSTRYGCMSISLCPLV